MSQLRQEPVTAGDTEPALPVEPPQFRAVTAEVVKVVRLSPSFVRITLGGPGLAGFGSAGADQRIKLLFAPPGTDEVESVDGDDWYLRWRALPDDRRPLRRTYTVRAHRPDQQQIDVDFVLHGGADEPSGPASAWAARARPGDRLGVIGPDRPGTGRWWGVEWAPPATAKQALIAGDETALPAISAILEALRPGLRARVLVELPGPGDVPTWDVPAAADVRWLVRQGPTGVSERGELLEAAVREALPVMIASPTAEAAQEEATEPDPEALLWETPEGPSDQLSTGEPYVWLAGEAEVMRRLRRLARIELGLARTSVACMGYWRRGHAET